MEMCGINQLTVMTRYLCRSNHKPINQIKKFALEEEISVKRFQIAVN